MALAIIPKSGSQSMRRVLRQYKEIPAEEVRGFDTRVAFIRHPVARLGSAFRFFHWLMIDGVKCDKTAPPKSVLNEWPKFVDYALENDNPHWRSQISFISDDSGMVANRLHKFENVGRCWEEYYQGILPWINATSKVPYADYRVDDINRFYKADLELWHGL